MTAFDLIGIVSTQMLNNVFTRSLQEERSVKTYTRFVSKASPAKILLLIQEAVRRMADCKCCFERNSYDFNVIKDYPGGQRIQVNIQIYQTPANEYWVECRRASGNIFKYHEFFDEFRSRYEDAMARMDKKFFKDIIPTKKIKYQQIQFRNKNSNNSNNSNNNNNNNNNYNNNRLQSGHSNHMRSASEPQKLDSSSLILTQSRSNRDRNRNSSDINSSIHTGFGNPSTADTPPMISPSPSPILPSTDNQIVFDFDNSNSNNSNSSKEKDKENENQSADENNGNNENNENNDSNESNDNGNEQIIDSSCDNNNDSNENNDSNNNNNNNNVSTDNGKHRRTSSAKKAVLTVKDGRLAIPKIVKD